MMVMVGTAVPALQAMREQTVRVKSMNVCQTLVKTKALALYVDILQHYYYVHLQLLYSYLYIEKLNLCCRTLLMHTDASVPLGLRVAAVKSTSMTVSQILVGMEQHVL